MKTSVADTKLALSYFGALEGDLYDAFMKGARNPAINESYSFFHTTDTACASDFGTEGTSIALSRQFDESPLKFAGNDEELVTFAKASAIPRLITFGEDYIEPIFGDHNPAIMLFTEETGTAYQDVFSQAAKELQGEILFVTSGVSEGIQTRLGEFIGIDKSMMPAIRLLDPQESMLKYLYDGDVSSMTVADISKFVKDFKAGSLEPFLKSEDVPDPQTVDGLTVMVGKSFDSIVNDPTKDVLVKYYAPWCGHCKSLAPIWADLAKDVESIDDLVIAKFDATVNEVKGLEIRGYPTLKFYPKGDKSGLDYNGDRKLEDF